MIKQAVVLPELLVHYWSISVFHCFILLPHYNAEGILCIYLIPVITLQTPIKNTDYNQQV